MNPALRPLGSGDKRSEISGLIDQFRSCERLADQYVHDSLRNPFPYIKARVRTCFDAGGHPNGEFATCARFFDLAVNLRDPFGHDLASLIHFIGTKVVGRVVKLELESIDEISRERLLDEGKALVA